MAAIFNNSLSKGVVPKQWKSAVVTPVFKGGKASNPGVYRPLSLLPIISKVLEHFVHKQLIKSVDLRKAFDMITHKEIESFWFQSICSILVLKLPE